MKVFCVSLSFAIVLFLQVSVVAPNPDARRLYEDLLTNYNKLIRPVANNSDKLMVKLGLRLSQLIDVNLKNQIMTTNVWLDQEWMDYKLTWNPDDYGGLETLHVPAHNIWLPDIVLYNNADGNYEITIMTKAILNYTGRVRWKPPAIYKSSCEIDVEYFPYDEQKCHLKFGCWTYDFLLVDLRHMNQTDSDIVEVGMDLQDYSISVEWDIMKVPAQRNEKYYSCCNEHYVDIHFNITLRRKTLFYTVNLIIPCVGISFLSVFVFYLPSDSGEKISLCISILLSLTVFFLLLAEIIPPTSLAVPLLGKYLLFAMTLITFSVVVTICILNLHYRSPATHTMPAWVKKVFIHTLPPFLFIQRPGGPEGGESVQQSGSDGNEAMDNEYKGQVVKCLPYRQRIMPSPVFLPEQVVSSPSEDSNNDGCDSDGDGKNSSGLPLALLKSAANARFVSVHKKNKDDFQAIEEDWKYVAMVLDRLFLWIFTLACIIGTVAIIFQAPSLYDRTVPIDIQYSKNAKRKQMQMGPEES